ncbi:MAG TPA: YchJ family metal-binding protein [Rhabdochlamydiaceae bacterium]|jgi:SEC-C motif-containing protein|nr:YchJ family metal-binding protein [Rhabdochlamydiaceae bacterium]
MELCLCGSGKKYAACCGSSHHGKQPISGTALMRSRYSAYALGLVDYILKTTHPDHPDAKRPEEIRRKEIEEFCQTTTFRGLKILEVQEWDSKGVVKFTAFLRMDGHDFSFTEKSTFEKVNGQWLYLKGELSLSTA